MRILFLNSSHFDYQQDLTYSGLVKLLGQENVIDFPWNPKFHLKYKPYPKNLGYGSFSFPKFLPNFSTIDLVVLGSAKKDVLEVYTKLLSKITNTPILFLDGGDRAEIGGDFYRFNLGKEYEDVLKKRPFDFILKREYIPSLHESVKNVFSFPFSFPFNLNIPTCSETDKKYDVSFWGQQNPEIRANALKMLEDKYDCKQNGTTLNQNFSTYKRKGKFYLEEISRCKIVLNFRGGGWDTMRYWEVPAVGSFMISQKPQIVIPNNFEEGKHIAWCSDSLDDLIDKIDYYLENGTEREKMASQAREHLNKFHLNTSRASSLLEIVKRHL
ncbi:MAG: glycosyltransferase [Cyclobacteriaceae bacterium]